MSPLSHSPFLRRHSDLFDQFAASRQVFQAAQEVFQENLTSLSSPITERLSDIATVTRQVLAKRLGSIPSREQFSSYVPSDLQWVHSYHSLTSYYKCVVTDVNLDPQQGTLDLTLRWPEDAQPPVVLAIPVYLLSASQGDVAGGVRRFLELKEARSRVYEKEERTRLLWEKKKALKALEREIAELDDPMTREALLEELDSVPPSPLKKLRERIVRGE